MYLRLGEILSGWYLISFANLINSSFSSSLHLSISPFFTNISSSPANEQMLLILMSLFNQDLLCPLLFQLALLIFVVLNYFLLIPLIFHFAIFCFNFLLISSISTSASHLFVQIYLTWSANFWLVKGKTPISSHIFFILSLYFFCGLSLYLTLSYNLVYCLFPLHSLFCLIRCLMTTCCGPIKYPVYAERDTFTTSGSSPVNSVVLNSLIWHFTLLEAVCLWFPSTSVFFETPSLERLPPKAVEFFLPMRQTIPRQMPIRYSEVLGNWIIFIKIIIVITIITLLFSDYKNH